MKYLDFELPDFRVGICNLELQYYGIATACCNNTTLKPRIYSVATNYKLRKCRNIYDVATN
ncbi:4966_t:CDS:1, partial [Funneliformis mosseae]